MQSIPTGLSTITDLSYHITSNWAAITESGVPASGFAQIISEV
jgi:hypothetical protein